MNLIFKNFWNTLRRYKMASVLNIVGLSVAFAAFAVIMMQVRYDLTFDRFHTNAERIFRVEAKIYPDEPHSNNFPRPAAHALMNASGEIEQGGILNSYQGAFSADNQSFTTITNTLFTPDILKMFDIRVLSGDTARLHQPGTGMLSQSEAERFFPGQDPIGQPFFGEGYPEPLEVVAVIADFPKNSRLLNGVWQKINDKHDYDNWGNWSYNFFVQLRSSDKTRAEEDIQGYTWPELPKQRVAPSDGIRLTPLTDLYFQTDISVDKDEKKGNRATTYTLILIAILIVLIAAINFVNFSTSLVPVRLRAVNTQRVLGNSVEAIRGVMIGEAVGLTVISLALGYWLVYALSTTSFTSFLSVDLAFGKNWPVLGLTAAVALATGLLAGLYPAFYITSFQPALVLKGSFGLSQQGKRLRTALISVQYVISLALIIVALFMRAQNQYMKEYPLGFERENLLVFNISQSLAERAEALSTELTKNPAVRQVAYAGGGLVAPSRMSWGREEANGEKINVSVLPVSPGFPELLGIEITEGRSFVPSDDLSKDGVFLFNETAKHQFGLTLESAVSGHRAPNQALTAGFFRDFHSRPVQYTIDPFALYVFGEKPWSLLTVAYARVEGADIAGVIEHIRRTVQQLDPTQTEVQIDFLDATIGNLYAKEDQLANLITLFSLLAVLISMIGVFGLVLFETQYRRKEIGLRKVHGATIAEILSLLNRNFVRIVVACFVVAAPVAYYAVRRWLEGFAYQSPVHWWIFAAALLTVLVITVLTVTLQSYRAATENPVNSIKTE